MKKFTNLFKMKINSGMSYLFWECMSERGKKNSHSGKKCVAFSDIINLMYVCEKLNMKSNVHVFLPVQKYKSAKCTGEVTQNTQFILRGLFSAS